jgi:hypothetical protein
VEVEAKVHRKDVLKGLNGDSALAVLADGNPQELPQVGDRPNAPCVMIGLVTLWAGGSTQAGCSSSVLETALWQLSMLPEA